MFTIVPVVFKPIVTLRPDTQVHPRMASALSGLFRPFEHVHSRSRWRGYDRTCGCRLREEMGHRLSSFALPNLRNDSGLEPAIEESRRQDARWKQRYEKGERQRDCAVEISPHFYSERNEHSYTPNRGQPSRSPSGRDGNSQPFGVVAAEARVF